AASDRGPEVADQRVSDEAAVLDGERVVQVELGAHPRDLLGGGGELGQHHLHRVAGDEEEETEDRQRHAEEDGHACQDARGDVGQHGPSVVRGKTANLWAWKHARYSTISSARASTEGGIVRASALAVLLLITSSNFVGCSMGRSASLAPFKILST